MRGLERWQDPFDPCQKLKGLQRVLVSNPRVLGAARVVQPRVLGADRGVIQPCRNRMRQLDVAIGVLEDVAARALEHARCTAGEARSVPTRLDPVTAGFDANQAHVAVVDERVEDAHGVTAAADARDDRGRQPADRLETLGSRLAADDRLKFANHQRVGMRSEHRAQEIVAIRDGPDPVAHGLVDGILQRSRSGVDAPDFCPEQLHAENVERLARHVFRAHVDVALQPEQRAGGRRCDAVLSCARLRDDPRFPHATGQQGLADRVVDLVRAGMRQVFALEKHARSAGV